MTQTWRELAAEQLAGELLDAEAERDTLRDKHPDDRARVWRDPYRPLEPGAQRVDYYEPSYVRGREDA